MKEKGITTLRLVEKLKDYGQDFEWYPTTGEILNRVKTSIDKDYPYEQPSILDCGAGDGRSLMNLTEGERYAIEKSVPLIEVMDRSICIVGTEFREQTLIDKNVDVIFCNPPYSEYDAWMEKIIREALANEVYFVVPKRWELNKSIDNALRLRKAQTEVLDSFDFLRADRKARAEVDVVKVSISKGYSYKNSFDIWFDQTFAINLSDGRPSKHSNNQKTKEEIKDSAKKQVVQGGDLVKVLENLYQKDLDKLIHNYRALETIDSELLEELSVDLGSLKEALRLKIQNLKDLYWNELFENLRKITDCLVVSSRKRMLSKLTKHTHVDFSASNAYAIIIWVIKNSNVYFNDQLTDLVERMVDESNIKLYKSNSRTFGSEQWRYGGTPRGLDRYSLDYRIVLHRVGGLATSSYSFENYKVLGLSNNARDFINDILTVANNIGFDTTDTPKAGSFEWLDNSSKSFEFYDHRTKGRAILMEVRAFKNGNLHIKFNQSFICKLNVEFGRLKGWLKSKQQTSDELGIKADLVEQYFGSNLFLERGTIPCVGYDKSA